MIEKFINIKKLTEEEKEYLEEFYKNTLKEEKSKKIAQIKLINEAKEVIRLRSLEEEKTEVLDNNKLKINNILVEVTKEEIKEPNVEFSKKIKEAMSDSYIRDLMVYNEEFLNLMKNSDIEKEYITIYADYSED